MELSNVDTRRLRHFLAVLDAGGVREAARRIHVAQPALSRTIAELEEDLGVQLFVRQGRRMHPTDAAGIVATLHALSRLSFDHLPGVADQFHLLREFASDHEERRNIFMAID